MVKTYAKIMIECNIPQFNSCDSPMETTYYMTDCLVKEIKEKGMLDKWMTNIELCDIGLVQSIDLTIPITEIEDNDKDNGDIDLEKTDILTVPKTCDDCFALGSNGICGYCKFTMECYAGKDDLLEDKRLKDCPFREKEEKTN